MTDQATDATGDATEKAAESTASTGEQTSEAKSIWDAAGGEAVDDAKQPEGQAEQTPTGDWFFDENVPGKGERPEWLKDKYKSVSDQAKSYVELEKRLGEFRGAPKDGYDLSSVEGLSDDPMVKHFAETFKELNLSQDGFNRVLNEFVELQGQAAKVDIDKEISSLGIDGKQQVTQIKQWIDNTFDEGTRKTIQSWVSTADDFKALQALKAFQPRSAIPSEATAQSYAGYETVKELENEKSTNWAKYKEDPNYRAGWQDRLKNAHAREQVIAKRK